MPFIKKNKKTKTNNIQKKKTNAAKKQSTPKINNVSLVEQIKQLLKENVVITEQIQKILTKIKEKKGDDE